MTQFRPPQKIKIRSNTRQKWTNFGLKIYMQLHTSKIAYNLPRTVKKEPTSLRRNP